jgi:hypothetical protein
MSLSLIGPRRSQTDVVAPPRPKTPAHDTSRIQIARATQADATWILAATVVFVGFQVFALFPHGS